MKIACFYPRNLLAGWYTMGGYATALKRLGHKFLDCPFPGNQPHNIEHVAGVMPTVEQLADCDLIMVHSAEWINDWLKVIYGDAWLQLPTPKVARYDESFDRNDIGLPNRWTELQKWADFHCFHAAQDAERYNGTWLPQGADTTIFKSGHTGDGRRYPLGFIGSMYNTRIAYLESLRDALPGANVTFSLCAWLAVQDLSGVRGYDTALLLAMNYRQIDVFFCLPPLSKGMANKAFEVMSCGTFLMYPKWAGDAKKNMGIFKDNEHLVYYEPGYVNANAEQIQYWLDPANAERRQQIAKAGQAEAQKYSLDNVLSRMIGLGGSRSFVANPALVVSQ